MRIEYHRTLIADRVRNEAFRAALAQVIKRAETVVADLGAGTGIMGFMAARLGAREVFLYEQAEILGVARQIARASLIKGCRFIAGSSLAVAHPVRVDVVVSETLGNYALEEDIIDTLNDARLRHLKPGGVLIPGRIEQFACPVIAPRWLEELTVWDRTGLGLDFSPARRMSLNNIYVRTFTSGDLLAGGGAAQRWDTIDFSAQVRPVRRGTVEWRAAQRTTLYGLALWWRAELVAGVSLATGPLDPRTHWEQLYLPVLEPIVLGGGDTLIVSLRSTSSPDAGTDVAWSYAVRDSAGHERSRQKLDLAKGFLP